MGKRGDPSLPPSAGASSPPPAEGLLHATVQGHVNAWGAVDLDPVPTLVTPGVSLVASQVKVSRKRAALGKGRQVFPCQYPPGQLRPMQLVFWVPRGCHRLKHHVFSYHPVFQPCQSEGGGVPFQVSQIPSTR